MARKSSDLFSLLATRGGNRRGGIFSQVTGALGSMFRNKRQQPGPRRVVMSGLGFLAVCFVCAGIGYLIGDQFPMSPARQVLRANAPDNGGKDNGGKTEGQRPGPMTNPAKPKPNAFYVGNFDDDRAKADELTKYLKGQGVARASTYGAVRKGDKDNPDQNVWLVVVYFDTQKEEDAVRLKLRTLQAPATVKMFETWRSTKEWPIPTVL